ncbi:hypothetical protein EIN_165430 [Entamoeba invadens IP1]|uniref:Uncharacterized protein n=1 Tax=Entamoeba invadens IP1 TaxID=370355 RepID=A0A0A1U4B6_ENTIV|nr:hypothetical protein EIN_165430 [Entamoeba invadens IP1]ELP89073.1 hypothetical protein EIN_165430 [Entamoeba invadens IP1]|eukprot:XP_004255844.1 hypothetical protein EIN_165430 [Entamoeba invadens IP1]
MSIKERLATQQMKIIFQGSAGLQALKTVPNKKALKETATESVYTTDIIVNGIQEDIIVAGSKEDLPPPQEYYPPNEYMKSDYNIYVVLIDSITNELGRDDIYHLTNYIRSFIPAIEETDDYYFGEFEFLHFLVQNLVAIVFYNTNKSNTHYNPKIEEMFHGRCLHFAIGDIDKESISRIIQKTITAKRSGFAGRYFGGKPVILLYDENGTKGELDVSLKFEGMEVTEVYPKTEITENTLNWTGRYLGRGTEPCVLTIKDNDFEYLFWESLFDVKLEGFDVKVNDLSDVDKLMEKLGLNVKERNDFVVYWMKEMKKFQKMFVRIVDRKQYEKLVPLNVKGFDNVMRIFVGFGECQEGNEYLSVQEVESVKRPQGKYVIEWGATPIQ